MVYTANWGIIRHLPPFTRTKNNHWQVFLIWEPYTSYSPIRSCWFARTLVVKWANVSRMYWCHLGNGIAGRGGGPLSIMSCSPTCSKYNQMRRCLETLKGFLRQHLGFQTLPQNVFERVEQSVSERSQWSIAVVETNIPLVSDMHPPWN